MKILIIGASGQVGSEFKAIEHNYPHHQFYYANSADINLNGVGFVSKIKQLFEKLDAIINCAAYTKVDLAEQNQAEANRINNEAVHELGQYANEQNLTLVHYSTDYVFDGLATSPYTITQPKCPVNYYGLTKSNGEIALENVLKKYIIRTAWVYSTFGNNFIKTMQRLAKTNPELNVVADQIGAPTYAKHLAIATLQILENKIEYGTYHYTNTGSCTWHEFAVKLFELTQQPIKVNPIPTAAYPTPAKRPQYSILDTIDLQNKEIIFHNWVDALKEMVSLQQQLGN
jgi:dTDP-4-dehydrorhamnose reductase